LNESSQNQSNGSDEVESTRNFHEELLEVELVQLTPDEQAAVDSLPAGNALLIVRKGPNRGSRFLLDSDLITVGRHPNADVFLDDVTVSRRHAEIKRNAGEFTVTDLASLNGTYYQGSRVESHILENESELQIGKYHFTFYAAKRNN